MSTGQRQRVKLAQAIAHDPHAGPARRADRRPRPRPARRHARPHPPRRHRVRHRRRAVVAPARGGRAGLRRRGHPRATGVVAAGRPLDELARRRRAAGRRGRRRRRRAGRDPQLRATRRRAVERRRHPAADHRASTADDRRSHDLVRDAVAATAPACAGCSRAPPRSRTSSSRSGTVSAPSPAASRRARLRAPLGTARPASSTAATAATTARASGRRRRSAAVTAHASSGSLGLKRTRVGQGAPGRRIAHRLRARPSCSWASSSLHARRRPAPAQTTSSRPTAEYYGFIVGGDRRCSSAFVAPEVLCTDRRTGMLGLYLARRSPRHLPRARPSPSAACSSLVTLGPPLLMMVAFMHPGRRAPTARRRRPHRAAHRRRRALASPSSTPAVSIGVSSLTDRKAFASAGSSCDPGDRRGSGALAGQRQHQLRPASTRSTCRSTWSRRSTAA